MKKKKLELGYLPFYILWFFFKPNSSETKVVKNNKSLTFVFMPYFMLIVMLLKIENIVKKIENKENQKIDFFYCFLLQIVKVQNTQEYKIKWKH